MAGWMALRLRAHLRGNRGSLFAVTLLVAIVGATVFSATAGVRRTRSVLERADDAYAPPDVLVQFAGDSYEPAEPIATMPQVEAVDRLALYFMVTEAGFDGGFVGWMASLDGAAGTETWRSKVVGGRLPHDGAFDEIAVPESVAAGLGVDVGDPLRLYSLSPVQGGCLDGLVAPEDPRCAGLEAVFDGGDTDVPSTFKGPIVDVKVVGFTRSLLDVGSEGTIVTALLPSGFYEHWGEQLPSTPAAVVRLRDGVETADFDRAFAELVPESAVREYSGVSSEASVLEADADVYANAILTVGVVAGVVGLFALGITLVRYASAVMLDGAALAALGVTRRMRIGEVVAVAFLCAAVGALGAAALAIGVSDLVPTGTAAMLEPDDGIYVDVAVLVIGIAVLIAVVGVGAALAGVLATRRRAHARRRPFGARIPISTKTFSSALGARFATTRGTGVQPVPVGLAIGGVMLAATGVVATSALDATLDDLVTDPARQGWNWDWSFSPQGERPEQLERIEEALLADEAIAGVTRVHKDLTTSVNGVSTITHVRESLKGDVEFVSIRGHLPEAPDEIALGGKTLDRLGVDIGDEVDVASVSMRVVGTTLFPADNINRPIAEGALLHHAGISEFGIDVEADASHIEYFMTLAPGADEPAVLDRVTALMNESPPIGPHRPREVDQLSQIGRLPETTMVLMLLVAFVSLGYTLVATITRRRHELAILRAIGITPGQTRRTIWAQAAVIAVLGSAVGLAFGWILGRVVWAAIAHEYAISDAPEAALGSMLLVVPAAIVVALALAWWPGVRAARIRPASLLRSE